MRLYLASFAVMKRMPKEESGELILTGYVILHKWFFLL
jgi:hypothetical protein